MVLWAKPQKNNGGPQPAVEGIPENADYFSAARAAA